MSSNPLGRTASIAGTYGKRAPEMINEYYPKMADIWMLGSESSSPSSLVSSDVPTVMCFELLEAKEPWRESSVDVHDEEELFAWMDENMQVLQLSPRNDHWTADHFLRHTVYKHAQGRATAQQLLVRSFFFCIWTSS